MCKLFNYVFPSKFLLYICNVLMFNHNLDNCHVLSGTSSEKWEFLISWLKAWTNTCEWVHFSLKLQAKTLKKQSFAYKVNVPAICSFASLVMLDRFKSVFIFPWFIYKNFLHIITYSIMLKWHMNLRFNLKEIG